MSERFYGRHGLVGLKERRFWTYRGRTDLQTVVVILSVISWWVTRSNVFLRSAMLREVMPQTRSSNLAGTFNETT